MSPMFQAGIAVVILNTYLLLHLKCSPYRSSNYKMGHKNRVDIKDLTGHQPEEELIEGDDLTSTFLSRFAGFKYTFDYNMLESSLLGCGVFVVLSGLLFHTTNVELRQQEGVGMPIPGFRSSWLLTFLEVVVIISLFCSISVFMFMLIGEILRSIRFASRQQEQDSAFEAMSMAISHTESMLELPSVNEVETLAQSREAPYEPTSPQPNIKTAHLSLFSNPLIPGNSLPKPQNNAN